MDIRCCQPGSNTADCRAVDPAVYGYASVVTSRPRSRAPRMSWSSSGVSRWPMLVTWTTCREAPVAAASAITSCSAATLVADRGSAGERLVVRDERPACAHMADADAVVDQAPALAHRVPGRHRVSAELQFQRGRHAVVRVVAVALRVLAMCMQIDEP